MDINAEATIVSGSAPYRLQAIADLGILGISVAGAQASKASRSQFTTSIKL